MKYLIITLLQFNFGIAMGQSFVVKPAEELLKILEQSEIVSDDDIEYNMASVYGLADNRIIVLPNFGTEGILFYDKGSLQKMIDDRKFPVKGTGNVFELYVDDMLQVEKTHQKFIDQLGHLLGMKVEVSDDPKNLDSLSAHVNKFMAGKDKNDLFNGKDNLYVPLGIFFHELVRQHIKGTWGLDKEYTLNPYYTPYITDEKNRTYRIWPTLADRLRGKTFYCRKFLSEISKPVN